mgnify:CR=1 FL=1
MKYGNIVYNAFIKVFEAMPIAVLFNTANGLVGGSAGGGAGMNMPALGA